MASQAPSNRVVEAVAEKKGVLPTELSPPLYSAVEPEALDALVQPDTDSNTDRIEIEFTYLDYVVRVTSGPTVSVSVRDGDATIDNSESVPEQGVILEK